MRQRRAVLAYLVAAVIGAGLVVLVFHPGFMSGDSVDQLGQARTALYHAHHPPLMAWVWRYLDELIPGPLGMLLLQAGLFWGGLALVIGLTLRTPFGALLVLAIGLFPPVFVLAGTIWKDVQMGSAFLAVLGLLLLAETLKSRWPVYLALLPMAYGCAVRANGIVTAFPLMVVGCAVLDGRQGWMRPVVVAWVLAAVLALAIGFCNRRLTRGEEAFGFQQAMLHDLVALSVAREQDQLPAYLQEGPEAMSLSRMRALYTPASADPLFWPPTPGPNLTFSSDPARIRTLEATWRNAVAQSPGAYLRHRLRYVKELLGIGRGVAYPFFEGIGDNDLGLHYQPSWLTRRILGQVGRLKDGLLFCPWIYLLAILVSWAVSGFRRQWDPVPLACGVSGFFNLAPYLVFGPAPDFRYMWWSVIGGLLSLVFLFAPNSHGTSTQRLPSFAPSSSR